jgi:hypothetical protein
MYTLKRLLLGFATKKFKLILTLMEKFMLIMREDLIKLRQYTNEERFADMHAMFAWTQSLTDAGQHVHSEPLAISGSIVSKTDVLTDGPFIESKEGIAGYFIILAENLKNAVSIAQTCPLVKTGMAIIEVRPVLDPARLAPKPK